MLREPSRGKPPFRLYTYFIEMPPNRQSTNQLRIRVKLYIQLCEKIVDVVKWFGTGNVQNLSHAEYVKPILPAFSFEMLL